jgi:hypothetical protein
MTLLIMAILITLNMGDITYNDITYNWLYLLLILLINDFTYNSNNIKEQVCKVAF